VFCVFSGVPEYLTTADHARRPATQKCCCSNRYRERGRRGPARRHEARGGGWSPGASSRAERDTGACHAVSLYVRDLLESEYCTHVTFNFLLFFNRNGWDD